MTGKPKRNLVSYLGFAAWLAYGLLGAREYWRTAACAGLVIMLAIVAYEILTRRIKMIALRWDSSYLRLSSSPPLVKGLSFATRPSSDGVYSR